PVKLLRRGRDIIQYFGLAGYVTSDRINNLVHGVPPLVHAQGYKKPWIWFDEPQKINGFREFLWDLYLDLSPPTLIALSYQNELDESCAWMNPRYFATAALRAAGLWYPPLVGLPITVIFEVGRLLKRAARRGSAPSTARANTHAHLE